MKERTGYFPTNNDLVDAIRECLGLETYFQIAQKKSARAKNEKRTQVRLRKR